MPAVSLGLILFMLASSSLPSLDGHSVSVRILGAGAVVAPVIWRRRLGDRRGALTLGRTWVLVGLGYGIYVLSAQYLHGDLLGAFTALSSFFLVTFFLFVLLNYYSRSQIVGGVTAALATVCGGSIAYGLVRPEIAIENDRLRGILENANGLGFVGFSLGAIALFSLKKEWVAFAALGLSSAAILWSASRASALALATFLIVSAVIGTRRSRAYLPLGFVGGMLLLLAFPGITSGVQLFRTTDSRSLGLEVMESALRDSFWIGIGEIPSAFMVAGSLFAAGITGGALGLAGTGIMYLGFLRKGLGAGKRSLAVVIAYAIHSVFESWMLSFSAPMMLAVCVVLIVALLLDNADGEPVESHEGSPGGHGKVKGLR